MKKILLAIVVTLSLSKCYAQLNFSGGYTTYKLTAPGFQTFFRTYNEVNASTLQTQFKDDFPAASGWNFRLGYLVRNHDGGGVYYNSVSGMNHLVTSNEAIYSNGEIRRTELRIREWETDVSLGVGADNFHLAINGAFTLRNNRLLCSYIFKDGSESFGLDHNLNGIFSASRLCAGYGAEAGIGVKNAQIVFRAMKVYKPFEKDGSTYLDSYDDLVNFKEFNPNGSYPTEYMPADFHQFLADQLTSESNNNFVYINDHGWQFSLSLMLLIPSND